MLVLGYNKNGLKRRKKSYRRRKKTLDLRKVGIAALSTVIAISLGYLVYTHLPFVKVNKAIAAGDKFAESADYESAIESYLKALDIDKTSVTAYSNLAGAYLGIDDTESAKKVLYEGYQNTQNQGLLDNYHTVILNEAVATMNDGNTDLTTVENIFGVLSEDNSNASAVSLLSAACDRTMQMISLDPEMNQSQPMVSILSWYRTCYLFIRQHLLRSLRELYLITLCQTAALLLWILVTYPTT